MLDIFKYLFKDIAYSINYSELFTDIILEMKMFELLF